MQEKINEKKLRNTISVNEADANLVAEKTQDAQIKEPLK